MIVGSSLFFFGTTNDSKPQSHLELFLTPEEKVSVRSYFRDLIEDIVKTNLLGSGNSDLHRSALAVIFDDEKFAREAALHYTTQIEEQKARGLQLNKQQEAVLRQLALIKPKAEESEFPLTAKQAAEEAPVSSQRFGKLNIDITSHSLNEVVNKQYQKEMLKEKYLDPQRPISLMVQIPDAETQLKPFRYDALNYIKSVQVSVVLPNTAPVALIEKIRNEILANPDLKRATQNDEATTVTVLSDHQSLLNLSDLRIWWQNLLNTNHPSIGGVLLFVGLIALGVSAFFVYIVPLWLTGFRAKNSETRPQFAPPVISPVSLGSEMKAGDLGNKHVQYVRDNLCALSRQNLKRLREKLSDKELIVCVYILPLKKTAELLDRSRPQEVFEAIEKMNTSTISTRILSSILDKIEKTGVEINLQAYIERVCQEAKNKTEEQQVLDLIPEHRTDLIAAQRRVSFFVSDLKSVPSNRLEEFVKSLRQAELLRILAVLEPEDRELLTDLLPTAVQLRDQLRTYMSQPGVIEQLQRDESEIRRQFKQMAGEFFATGLEDEIRAA